MAYGQSKLADLMIALRLAAVAAERGWNLMSTPRTRGSPGRTCRRGRRPRPGGRADADEHAPILPSQGVQAGTEPLLYAATSLGAVNGGYYGPNGFEIVGPAPPSGRPGRRGTPRWPAGSGPRRSG